MQIRFDWLLPENRLFDFQTSKPLVFCRTEGFVLFIKLLRGTKILSLDRKAGQKWKISSTEKFARANFWGGWINFSSAVTQNEDVGSARKSNRQANKNITFAACRVWRHFSFPAKWYGWKKIYPVGRFWHLKTIRRLGCKFRIFDCRRAFATRIPKGKGSLNQEKLRIKVKILDTDQISLCIKSRAISRQ